MSHLPSVLGSALLAAACAGTVGPVARLPPIDLPVPGEAAGEDELQRDTFYNIVSTWEAEFAPECSSHRVVDTRILKRPSLDESQRVVSGDWVELWALDRCGTVVHYEVTYIPDGRGGTFISTQPRADARGGG